MYAVIENGVVAEFPILSLNQRFPDISFPVVVTDADLPTGVVRVYPVAPPPYNPNQQKVVQDTVPVFADGKWGLGYTAVDLSAAELTAREQTTAQNIRTERNDRLLQCDWTQLADSPVDKASWATYRQSLRDIPSQQGFPFNVSWPTPPA